jgi:hypothetical protein
MSFVWLEDANDYIVAEHSRNSDTTTAAETAKAAAEEMFADLVD